MPQAYSEQDNTRDPLKAALWEEAKGKLRALVAVQGSYSTGIEPLSEGARITARWQRLDATVMEFITDIERNGLQE